MGEINEFCLRPFTDNRIDSDHSLLKLKIVLLRRINKLLEENPDAEETPEHKEELTKLRSAINDIEKANTTRNSALLIDKPSLDTSFANGSMIQLSQSPLFKGDKLFKQDLAELTLKNSNLLDSSRIEALTPNRKPSHADELIGSNSKETGRYKGEEIDTLRVVVNELSKPVVKGVKKRSTSETPHKEIVKSKKALVDKKRKGIVTPKSKQPKGITHNAKKVQSKEVKKSNENVRVNAGVKGLKMTEPQLKLTVNKSKLEEGIKKTPLGHINSVLNKIKTGEM